MNKIVLFGAGSFGQKYYHETQNEVVCFIDNDKHKQGKLIYGKKILPPSELHHLSYDYIIISSIYESQIREQLIKMGLEDKISTPHTNTTDLSRKSFYYASYNTQPDAIVNDVNYAIKNALNYMNRLKEHGACIKNKSILEIGPGLNFSTALTLLCFGAEKVVVNDRYLVSYDNDYHNKLYKKTISVLTNQYSGINTDPIHSCLSSQSHNTEQLICIESTLEGLSYKVKDEFDITLSNAVFEHLYNPLKAFKSLFKTMKNNSIGLHQVDFSDHRNFEKPLEFLLMDELSFQDLMHNASCECGNRIRDFQMHAMFEEAGFTNISIDINKTANPDYLSSFIKRLKKRHYSLYSYLNYNQLKNISGCFTIYK